MYKKIIGFIVILTMAVTFFSACSLTSETKLESQPKNFTSQSQVKSLIDKFYNNTYNSNQKGGMLDSAENALPEAAIGAGDDYSRTNTQVEGVDEGDIVKVDGNYIYKLQSDGLAIISANNGDMSKIKSINIENYVPQELYVSGNKLILIGGIYKYLSYTGSRSAEPMMDCMYFSYNDTDIRIYDISDRANPVLERQLTISGYYFTSRLIDNKFYYITNYYFYYNSEENYIPKISDNMIENGAEKNIPLENIYYYESVPSYSYMILGSIDLSNPQTKSDLKAYLGLGGEIYVSENYIYTASADYSSYYSKNMFGVWSVNNNSYAKTRIVKLALSDLKQTAITRVDGTIKDRYSLDEYEGNLRVATTVNKWSNTWGTDTVVERKDDTATSSDASPTVLPTVNKNIYNNIFVLNSNLEMIGKCENIAYGETIYSVRFNKATGTLVTFRQIDPYFIINLSDPANPTVSNGLKEEGVSQYIHYLGDSNLTIGVGRETKAMETEWGNWVTWSGLKISLYDNSGAEAVNKGTFILGDEGDYNYAYSEIFYNPKALLYDEGKELFAFPVQIWNYGYTNGYYTSSTMTQGLAVFSFDIEAKTLTNRGIISNFDQNIDTNNWENYYINYWSFITRGVRIGDYIYTISERYITSYELTTLKKVNTLEVVTDPYNYNK